MPTLQSYEHNSDPIDMCLLSQSLLWAMAAARSWSCACSSGFGLRAGDHLQAQEASPGSIVSSALDLPPRKVPISASCAELLVSELRRGLDLAHPSLFSICSIWWPESTHRCPGHLGLAKSDLWLGNELNSSQTQCTSGKKQSVHGNN